MKGTKGYLYTLEAMIAALIIMSTVVVLYINPQGKPQFEASTLKDRGYACLKYLDNKGLLRYYAIQNNSQSLQAELQSCLPNLANFTTSFCTTSVNCTATELPGNKTIVLADYIVAGQADFQPTLINLYLWSRA